MLKIELNEALLLNKTIKIVFNDPEEKEPVNWICIVSEVNDVGLLLKDYNTGNRLFVAFDQTDYIEIL